MASFREWWQVDARVSRMMSASATGAEGNLAATAVGTNRVRFVLDGMATFDFGNDRALTPRRALRGSHSAQVLAVSS